MLAHLLENGRHFCIAAAKAVHTPVRRREEPLTEPTEPMAVASASLALLLRDGIAMKALGDARLPASADVLKAASDEQVHAWLRYVGRWVDLANSTLLDTRRRTCHTLVLNYLARGGGLVAITNAMTFCSWAFAEALAQEPVDAPARTQARTLVMGASSGCVCVDHAWFCGFEVVAHVAFP